MTRTRTRPPSSGPSSGPGRLSAREVRARYGEAGVAALTAKMRCEAARNRSLVDHRGPLGLQLALNPGWVETPALRLISDEMESAITTPGARLVISMPPQEGKTRLVRHAIIRALQHNPSCRVAVASYQARLARKTSEAARNIVSAYGSRAVDPVSKAPLPDRLGIAVQPGAAAAGDWAVDGTDGSVAAYGVDSGITGNAVDLLIVDDPLKGRAQADSATIRSKLHDWWDNDAETRLGPHSVVIVIQTRWHTDDLIGRLTREAAEEADEPDDEVEIERDDVVRVVNVPALADGVTLDSLADVPGGRTRDGWMVSARGDRSPKWRRLQKKRPRVFASLYQGRPAPLAGGIFEQAWIERGRVTSDYVRELALVSTAVAVDPADTGTGDAAGILVGSRAADGDLYVRADLTDQLSQRQWARRTLLAAVRYGADAIIQESNLGMGRALRDEWDLLQRQALALRDLSDPDDPPELRAADASAILLERGDKGAANADELAGLLTSRLAGAPETDPPGLVDAILGLPSSGPCQIVAQTPRQSKYVRAKAITGLYEEGRAHHVGTLANLELQQTTWQPGQPSPNELDTLAYLLSYLDAMRQPAAVSSPTRPTSARGGTPARPSGRGRIPTRTGRDPRRGVRRGA